MVLLLWYCQSSKKTALAYSKSSTTAQNLFCKIHILVWWLLFSMTVVHLHAGIFTFFAYFQGCLHSEFLFPNLFVYIYLYRHNAYATGRALIHIKCRMYFISLFSLLLEVVFLPFLFFYSSDRRTLQCTSLLSGAVGNFIGQILTTLCYSTWITFPSS